MSDVPVSDVPVRNDDVNAKRTRVQVTDTNPIPGPSHRIEEPQPSKSKIKPDNRRKSKMKKESIRLRNEINKLESQRDEIKEKIKKMVRGAHSGFKKKKIRNMNREATKLGEQIQELTNKLKKIEVNQPQISKVDKKL